MSERTLSSMIEELQRELRGPCKGGFVSKVYGVQLGIADRLTPLLELAKEMERVFNSGMKFIPGLIGRNCGNSEGTPCDDLKPSYVCPQHKWLKRARKLAKGGASE